MGGTHRIVKSLVALLAVVFIGLIGLLDYEVLLLIRHQANIEATVHVAFSKVDDVLLHMREQLVRIAAIEGGLQEVKSRVSGMADRYAMLQENQQSLLTRFDSLVTRVEVAFNGSGGRRADYAELLKAYQDSQQVLVELRQEQDAMRETVRRLETGSPWLRFDEEAPLRGHLLTTPSEEALSRGHGGAKSTGEAGALPAAKVRDARRNPAGSSSLKRDIAAGPPHGGSSVNR